MTSPSDKGRLSLAANLAATLEASLTASRERNLAIIARAGELDDQAVSQIAAQVAGALAARVPHVAWCYPDAEAGWQRYSRPVPRDEASALCKRRRSEMAADGEPEIPWLVLLEGTEPQGRSS